MARLETQINQIYLTHPETKKASLILYEEQLTPSLNLYVLAELKDLQKKSQAGDLKKISEIILQSFRSNKKLPAETLFETSLAQINQNLADLAHEGRKSWVGKFSCLILVKAADNNIYAANNGQTAVWLKRKSELMEILPAEKRGVHPLKTFINFTQGKLTDGDSLILTTSNIFNYVSFELFSKLIDQYPLNRACTEISKILQDSMEVEQAFCGFFLYFSKTPIEETIAPVPEVYAPVPEEIVEETEYKFPVTIPRLPRLRMPSFNFHLPTLSFDWLKFGWFKKFQWNYFQNLTRAGKFFLVSFSVFLLLFLINLGFYGLKLNGKKAQAQIDTLVNQINNDIASTQSALIYKNNDEALRQLAITEEDLSKLKDLDPDKASEITPKVEQIRSQINKINSVAELQTYVDLKHNPIYLAPATNGFLFANQDSNSLSLYADNTLTDYFLLNSLKSDITGIASFQPAGVVVSTSDEIHTVDQRLKQFEPLINPNLTGIRQIKSANNALYVLGTSGINKITYANNNYRAQVSITDDFSRARDLGVDKDIYVLFADKLVKYVSAKPQAFPMPQMSEPLTNGDKILVAANLYILESSKKRLIILNKNGALINQIYFPTAATLTDFYINESTRNIYLLDDNKLYKMTF